MGSRSPGIGVLRRAEIFVVHGPPAAMAAKPYLRAALLYAQEEARVYESGARRADHREPARIRVALQVPAGDGRGAPHLRRDVWQDRSAIPERVGPQTQAIGLGAVFRSWRLKVIKKD